MPTEGIVKRITHGRHCVCSACAREDWTNPGLAPCGMHGSSCPRAYDPWGAPGTLAARTSRERMHAALDAALGEDVAGVILAVYDGLSEVEVEQLCNAAQLVDSECQDLLEAFTTARKAGQP